MAITGWVTIIPSDNAVYVDGKMLPIDCSNMPTGIHAVQWSDEEQAGWIEFVYNGFGEMWPNVDIGRKEFDIMFADYRVRWHVENAKIEAAGRPAREPAAPATGAMNVIAD